jgi:large subunit ribosomal protein L18
MTDRGFEKRRKRCLYNIRKRNMSSLKIVSISKSNTNLYLHLEDTDGKRILSLSTLSKTAPKEVLKRKNCDAAIWLGKAMAEKLISMKIEKVVFNRAGYKFHGKVKEIVNSMSDGGIKCS